MTDTPLERTRQRNLNAQTVRPLADEFEIAVVGVTFVPAYPGNLFELERVAYLAEAQGERPAAVFVRRPDNPHDANAIEVHVPSLGESMGFVGHLPRAVAARLAPELDAGGRWQAEVVHVLISEAHLDRPGLRLAAKRVST